MAKRKEVASEAHKSRPLRVLELGAPKRKYTCREDLECDLATREARYQSKHQARMRAKYQKKLAELRARSRCTVRFDEWFARELVRKRGSFAFMHALVVQGGRLEFPKAPGAKERREKFMNEVQCRGLAPPGLWHF